MPNSRRFLLVGSSVSSGLLSRAGPVAGCSSVQVAPFQLQVSIRVGSAFAAPPPKRMTFPEEASKASAPKLRPGGETAGLSWLQWQPSHAQVSLSGVPSPLIPPKSTTVLVAASYVIAAPMRAGGGVPPGVQGVGAGVTDRLGLAAPLAEVQLGSIAAPASTASHEQVRVENVPRIIDSRFQPSVPSGGRGS